MAVASKIVDDYLAAGGSSRSELLFSTRGAREVIVYSSVMDGLGHATSDLDIYAISEQGNGATGPTDRIAAGQIGPQGALDVEWWAAADIALMCVAAEHGKARLDDLKVLHRLQIGIALSMNPAGIRKDIDSIDLQRPVIIALDLLADDEIRTYEGFISLGIWRSALLAARRAATYATMAWCARQGRLLFKEKWLMTVLAESWPEMAAAYWTAMTRDRETDPRNIFNYAMRLKSLSL